MKIKLKINKINFMKNTKRHKKRRKNDKIKVTIIVMNNFIDNQVKVYTFLAKIHACLLFDMCITTFLSRMKIINFVLNNFNFKNINL